MPEVVKFLNNREAGSLPVLELAICDPHRLVQFHHSPHNAMLAASNATVTVYSYHSLSFTVEWVSWAPAHVAPWIMPARGKHSVYRPGLRSSQLEVPACVCPYGSELKGLNLLESSQTNFSARSTSQLPIV